MNTTIRSLAGVSPATITATFNEAFSDYIVPLKLTQEALAGKMRSENIQLESSAAVFDGNDLVAFILTGIDTIDGVTVAYNAGTGVIPSYRGNKFTLQMYDHLLPSLKKKGVAKHLLEVITANVKALKIYEEIGFAVARKLVCFKGNIKNDTAFNRDVNARIVNGNGDIIKTEFWNSQPSYQNSVHSVKRDQENYTFLSAEYNNMPAGFLVYDPSNGRIRQFGVDKDFRKKGIGSVLFTHAQQQIPANQMSVINIDAGDLETIQFLQHSGLSSFVEQFEMTLSY